MVKILGGGVIAYRDAEAAERITREEANRAAPEVMGLLAA